MSAPLKITVVSEVVVIDKDDSPLDNSPASLLIMSISLIMLIWFIWLILLVSFLASGEKKRTVHGRLMMVFSMKLQYVSLVSIERHITHASTVHFHSGYND